MSRFSRARTIGAVAALLLAACGDDGSTTDAASGGIGGGEVRLEPADAEMPDPFVEENLDLVSDVGSTVDQLSKSIEGGLIEVPSQPVSGGLVDVAGQVASGDEPGLYWGTMNEGVCDAEQLVAFLTDPANAEVAQAWAEVQGVEVDEIGEYVEGLTPVRLAADTRVTNHGFAEGEATPFQSVLQAGTAVLVDEQGIPRAKCFCGNPLAPPEPVGVSDSDGELLEADDLIENPEDAWDGFEPADVVSVEPGEAVDIFELSDFETGARFARPVGTNGTEDEVIPPGESGGSDPDQSGGGAECRIEEYPDGSRREICNNGGGSGSGGGGEPSDQLAQCYAEAEQNGLDPSEHCGSEPPGGSGSAAPCEIPDDLKAQAVEIQQIGNELHITYQDGRTEVRSC